MATWSVRLISLFTSQALSQSDDQGIPQECQAEKSGCNDKSSALTLKIIAIVAIPITSMIGVCLPLFSRLIPALQPDHILFVVMKAFAAGIILSTGFMLCCWIHLSS
ncbi:hypothetical protein MRB53_026206 [Persea americana]|uniref:Uncharacterized protein n=1 Tax=Persea americana TaxID=3435 RepID=A0ACC2LHX7_PERAE|nr:hypothetical protein MRB53_026206 [Persea americana]